MNSKDFNVKDALVKAGKEEFLRHGYVHASLRTICRNANVSTGAFYAYFEKKEDLFSAIVDPMLSSFQSMYEGIIHKALTDIRSNERNEAEAIEFICAHRDEFRLLFDCSQGTAYAGFRDHLLNSMFMDSYQVCFERYAGCPVDPSVVRVFVRMKFAEYMELIYGGYSMPDVRQLIRRYSTFTEAGFLRLIEDLKTLP